MSLSLHRWQILPLSKVSWIMWVCPTPLTLCSTLVCTSVVNVSMWLCSLLQAEKLFKAAMSFMLSGGTPQVKTYLFACNYFCMQRSLLIPSFMNIDYPINKSETIRNAIRPKSFFFFFKPPVPVLSQKDDNAVIEMSLKLASIYATQNKWVLILCWKSKEGDKHLTHLTC